MSSAGHVQTMINSMRQNRAALKSKQAKFREKKLLSIQYKGGGQTITEPAISKEEMEAIKAEIRKEAKAEKIKALTKFIIILSVLSVGMVWALWYFLFIVLS